MAYEYQDSDGNEFPPDDPPVETIKFSTIPGEDTAIRYRCAGLSSKARWVYLSTVYCNKSIRYWKNNNFSIETEPCKIFPTIIAPNKRICNHKTTVSARFMTDRTSKRSNVCRLTDKETEREVNRWHCSTNPRINNLVHMHFPIGLNCKRVDPDDIVTSRICRNTPIWKLLPVQGIPRNRVCYVSPPFESTGNKVCNITPIGIIKDFKVFTHVCRMPGFVESIFIPAQYLCRTRLVGPPVPVLQGMVAPRLQTYTCYKTELFIYNPNGTKARCNNFVTVTKNTFKYSIVTCRMTSKIYTTTDMKTKKFNCGNIKLSNFTGLTFGRVFGGRPFTNMLLKTSGRMKGKLS